MPTENPYAAPQLDELSLKQWDNETLTADFFVDTRLLKKYVRKYMTHQAIGEHVACLVFILSCIALGALANGGAILWVFIVSIAVAALAREWRQRRHMKVLLPAAKKHLKLEEATNVRCTLELDELNVETTSGARHSWPLSVVKVQGALPDLVVASIGNCVIPIPRDLECVIEPREFIRILHRRVLEHKPKKPWFHDAIWCWNMLKRLFGRNKPVDAQLVDAEIATPVAEVNASEQSPETAGEVNMSAPSYESK